mgnify:CR=1 FL=1|tara:strand:- start:298 stop:1626 length:1329 start_codon:yes stop_codon:yes gene_type:complete
MINIESTPKKLVLMRHGVSCANQASGSPDVRRWTAVQPLLTMSGIDQAIRSVENLKKYGVDSSYHIICSMLPRSIFTASIVASFLGSDKIHVYPYIGETSKLYEELFFKGKSSQNVTTLHESLLYTEVIKYILIKLGIEPPQIDFSSVNREIINIQNEEKKFPSSSTPELAEQKEDEPGPSSSSSTDVLKSLKELDIDGFGTNKHKVNEVIDSIDKQNILMISHGDLLDYFTGSNIWSKLKNKKRALIEHETQEEIKYDANCSFLLTQYNLGNTKLVGELVVTPYKSVIMTKALEKMYSRVEYDEEDDDGVLVDVPFTSSSNSLQTFLPTFVGSGEIQSGLSNPNLPITILEAFLTCRHHLHGMILIPYFIEQVSKTLNEQKYFEKSIIDLVIEKLVFLFNEYFEKWNYRIIYNKADLNFKSFSTLEGLEAVLWNDETEPFF